MSRASVPSRARVMPGTAFEPCPAWVLSRREHPMHGHDEEKPEIGVPCPNENSQP